MPAPVKETPEPAPVKASTALDASKEMAAEEYGLAAAAMASPLAVINKA